MTRKRSRVKVKKAETIAPALTGNIALHYNNGDLVGYSEFTPSITGPLTAVEFTPFPHRKVKLWREQADEEVAMRALEATKAANVSSIATPTEPFLGLIVDERARKVASTAHKGLLDLSSAHAQWYCFWKLYRAGTEGVATSTMRANYPGKEDRCRQTILTLKARLAAVGVTIVLDGRRWYFVHHPDCDPTPNSV